VSFFNRKTHIIEEKVGIFLGKDFLGVETTESIQSEDFNLINSYQFLER
jgi:hypothetical protein